MIKKIEITGLHYELTDELKKYINKKFGKLDGYMSSKVAQSVKVDVRLKEVKKSKDKKLCYCEVVIHLPKENITVHESTINMFAAVDIVEAKLRNQIKRYKEMHHPSRSRNLVRGLLGKLKA